jgi:hypothetical protein
MRELANRPLRRARCGTWTSFSSSGMPSSNLLLHLEVYKDLEAGLALTLPI